MSDPSLWDAVERDPAMPLEPEVIAKVAADQRHWTRTWLYPLARPFSRVTVMLIVIAKRCVPINIRAHGTMDRLCLWFLRRFVSPLAVELLIRHFVIETNLLNFIVRNAGPPGMRPVSLRPNTLAGLGDRAVIEHDVNVYDVLGALGPGPLSSTMLDFTGLDMPPLDTEPHRRRILDLDIQTALCFMNVPFALCLTPEEYRRAVHSMRFDDSILALLADLTGDPTFLRWRNGDLAVRVDSNTDVPVAVYRHAVVCEFAHARLVRLAAGAIEGERLGAGR